MTTLGRILCHRLIQTEEKLRAWLRERGLQPDVLVVPPNEAANAMVASDRQRLSSFLEARYQLDHPLPVSA